jgi:transcriptional regulator with XRE-family HTH domain
MALTFTNMPPTRTALRLTKRMEELNLSIAEVAQKVGATYEHVRSLVRGKAVPSKMMVQAVADALRMNKVELERLATADRIRAKFGKIPLELSGKNPELEPLERVWQYLSKEHKADLIAQAEAWARRDREAIKRRKSVASETAGSVS